MSCTDEAPAVERAIELAAPPEVVWDSLPALLGDDVELDAEPGGRLRARDAGEERVGVVEEADAPRRLSFWWVPADTTDDGTGDSSPSRVELELAPTERPGGAVGTMLRVRETRFDTAVVVHELLRGPLARART